ncbi:hypothetical protein Krac_11935 [Ktedonobacter racemifer DSM 44963]|uniref:Uncharacterized protein n=1 Tax=Ktedonobacter racemifer DSM 44963 TaxID=485913 RepID=D6TEE4_KTERA|nr:hypothetical protein Krac_11935 [Ktedonobacter racemifer DSM 44963]
MGIERKSDTYSSFPPKSISIHKQRCKYLIHNIFITVTYQMVVLQKFNAEEMEEAITA